MKKLITILIIIFCLTSCGSRKKALEKSEQKTEVKNNEFFNQETKSTSESSLSYDLSNILENYSLKITPAGEAYQFKVGDLSFVGNAEVELSKVSNAKKLNVSDEIKTTFWSRVIYKSQTTYKTIITYKTLAVESDRDSYWKVILLILLGFILFPLLNYFLKNKLITIINNIF